MLPTPPPSPSSRGVCAPSDRLGHILPNGIQLTGILGVGAYGVVYTAQDIHNGTPYAVKALNKLGLDARQRKFLQREIKLHHQASQHPNVVSMIEIIDSPDCTYVVLEYCPEGDLFGNITDREQYVGNDYLAKRVFLQLLDAVEYCHSVGIYHRDLKPENILVTDGGMTVKLADFGLATTEFITSDFGCGSTFYMSPECLQPSPKPFACYASVPNDVWSLGVILVNLTCGRNPWKKASVDDSTFSAFLRDSEFLKTILPLTDELDWILRRIFECDPSRRITIPELRSMIMQCPAFTTQSSLASPPPEPVDYPKEFQPFSSADPSLVAQFSHLTTSSRSSGSDVDSVFSSSSSVSSSSSGSSYTQVSPYKESELQQLPQQPEKPCHYVSPPPNPWFANFMPALDLAQKHMSFQPLFSGVRMF